MPTPRAGQRREGVGYVAAISQQAIGHDRGDVFQRRSRDASWRYGEELPLGVADTSGGFLDALYVVAQVAQALAVLEMLTAVMAFLA